MDDKSDNIIEEWRDIPGYEGYYQVSNLGRVKGLKRTVNTWNAYKTISEHILKSCKTTNGYLGITLRKDGKAKRTFVHRLVGLAFIPNLENKPQIDHINGNKEDNRPSNLRWVTAKENCNNPLRVEKFLGENNHFYGKKHTDETRLKMRKNSAHLSGGRNPAARKILNKDTGEVFETVKDAGKSVGVSDNAIRNSIRRKSKSGGFYWRYI